MEELEKGILVRSELLERMTSDARHHARHQPTRLTQLDHRNDRGTLFQGGEASVQVGRLWHGATPSVIQRRWCHLLAACPIASPSVEGGSNTRLDTPPHPFTPSP